MRILITNCHLSLPHGSEIWTLVMAKELKRQGHDVWLWSPEVGMFWSRYMASDFPSISSKGTWMEEGFDIIILQHLRVLRELPFYKEAMLPVIKDAEHRVVICHSTYTDAEAPVFEGYLRDAHYVCISTEIAKHFDQFNWHVLAQPIDPYWFKIPARFKSFPEAVTWASHRTLVPDVLSEVCKELKIKLMAVGQRTTLPEDIQTVYRESDMIIGTGRWIYEAMAAGRACAVADGSKQLGHVTNYNVEAYSECNMTTRHRNAVAHDFEALLGRYNPNMGALLRTFAKHNNSAEVVVKNFFNILGT